MKTAALIVAGGNSARFGGDTPKQFLPLGGKPMLSQTIGKFQNAESIDYIVVVVAEEFLLYTSQNVIDPYGFGKVSKIVIGGSSRRESVLNGLNSLPISTRYVAIHDAARPLLSVSDINKVVQTAQSERAAILAQKSTDTVKRAVSDFIISTLDRGNLYQAQSPQVFQYDLIIAAHREYKGDDALVTDDSYLIEQRGFKVKIVEATSPNFKVTTKQDFQMAELLLKESSDV